MGILEVQIALCLEKEIEYRGENFFFYDQVYHVTNGIHLIKKEEEAISLLSYEVQNQFPPCMETIETIRIEIYCDMCDSIKLTLSSLEANGKKNIYECIFFNTK